MIIGLVENIEKFEKQISKLCNTKYAASLNSGTDAYVCTTFIRS